MEKLNYGYDSNVILDRCPCGHGVWAEDGELQRLAVILKKDSRWDGVAEGFIDEAQKSARDLDQLQYAVSRVLPYRPCYFVDTNVPVRKTAVIIWTFIIVNFIIYCIQPKDHYLLSAFFTKYGVIPSVPWSSRHHPSLLAGMFMHAGFLDLALNMYFLWIFGRSIENALGALRFSGLYIFGGLAAMAGHVLTAAHPGLPMVGASGAVSAVLGAFFHKYPRALLIMWNRSSRTMTLPTKLYLGTWIAVQCLHWILLSPGLRDVVSNGAWGAPAAGFLLGYLFVRPE